MLSMAVFIFALEAAAAVVVVMRRALDREEVAIAVAGMPALCD